MVWLDIGGGLVARGTIGRIKVDYGFVDDLLFGTEAVFDALKDIFQVGFDDLVVNLSAVAFAGQESASLHEPKVFRGHGGGDLAGLGQFGDRELLGHEHLQHAQAVRVGQDPQAFGGLAKRFQTR